MKTLLIIFILLVFSTSLWGQSTIIVAKKKAASCTTEAAPTDMKTVNTGETTSIFTYWDNITSKFVAGETATICKVCVSLKKGQETAPSYTISVGLYSDDGGYANALLTNGYYGDIAASSLTTDFAWYCLTEGSASLSNGTTYHLVMHSSGTDATNVVKIGTDLTCATESCFYDHNDPPDTNNSLFTDRCFALMLYK